MCVRVSVCVCVCVRVCVCVCTLACGAPAHSEARRQEAKANDPHAAAARQSRDAEHRANALVATGKLSKI